MRSETIHCRFSLIIDQSRKREIWLVHGNSKDMYSNRATDSSLDGEKITQNAGNITMQKSKNFEPYVQCLTNVGESPFELTDQVTSQMEMLLTAEYFGSELGPSIPNSKASLHHCYLATHTSSSFCFFDWEFTVLNWILNHFSTEHFQLWKIHL